MPRPELPPPTEIELTLQTELIEFLEVEELTIEQKWMIHKISKKEDK